MSSEWILRMPWQHRCRVLYAKIVAISWLALELAGPSTIRHRLNLNQSRTNCSKNLNSYVMIVREMGPWPEGFIFRSLLSWIKWDMFICNMWEDTVVTRDFCQYYACFRSYEEHDSMTHVRSSLCTNIIIHQSYDMIWWREKTVQFVWKKFLSICMHWNVMPAII